MAITYDLAQVQGTSSSSTYSTLYSAPSNAIVSTISICNTGATLETYRIAIMGTEGTPSAANWITYDSPVEANDTVFLSLGVVVPSGNYIRVSSSSTNITFSASVSEVS